MDHLTSSSVTVKSLPPKEYSVHEEEGALSIGMVIEGNNEVEENKVKEDEEERKKDSADGKRNVRFSGVVEEDDARQDSSEEEGHDNGEKEDAEDEEMEEDRQGSEDEGTVDSGEDKDGDDPEDSEEEDKASSASDSEDSSEDSSGSEEVAGCDSSEYHVEFCSLNSFFICLSGRPTFWCSHFTGRPSLPLRLPLMTCSHCGDPINQW